MLYHESEKNAFDHADINGEHGGIWLQDYMSFDQFPANTGRMFAKVTIQPGRTLKSTHLDEMEFYHVESGTGEYDANGEGTYPIGPGHVCWCKAGEYHAITCTGEEPLVLVGLILFEHHSWNEDDEVGGLDISNH